MKLTLKLAEEKETNLVRDFFTKNISLDTPGIINEEFLCPFGVSANIKRKQLVIIKSGYRIVGALRFYPRKRDDIVSLYQFAIDENFRGKGLMNKMLEKTGFKIFELANFKNSGFKEYLEKAGWQYFNEDKKNEYWRYSLYD